MRRIIIVMIMSALLFMFAGTVSAQPGWTVLNSGTGENLTGISAPSANTATAVGYGTTILRTTSGGLSWISQNSPQACIFRGVSFFDDNHGVTTGSSGGIFFTTNGGNLWQSEQWGYMHTYRAAHQLSQSAAYVTGSNSIFSPLATWTTNGWLTQQNAAFYIMVGGVYTEGTAYGIYFTDENNGFVAAHSWSGNGAVCRTVNGGQNWTTVYLGDYALSCIVFADASTGYAAGDAGMIVKTVNGGSDWVELPSGSNADLNGISFVSADFGWAVGDGGVILHTFDGGANWFPQYSGVTANLMSVSFAGNDIGYAAGDNGTILRYGDITPLDVGVTLTPAGPPIVIPANGGSFDFNISVTNNEPVTAGFSVWTMVTLPDGSEFGPVINAQVTVAAAATVDRDRTQAVPAGAPTGVYSYDACAGAYPDVVWDEAHFDFEKLAFADGGAVVRDWYSWGAGFSQDAMEMPASFTLLRVYPNPFNHQAALQFTLSEAGMVSLAIYDVQGRKVGSLADGYLSSGQHEVTWDAGGMVSGVYFVRLTVDGGRLTEVRKVLLVK